MLITCLVIQGICSPPCSLAEEPKPQKDKTIPISMFIPGFQQIKSRSYLKGVLLFAAFAGSTVGAFISNSQGNNWYDKYLASTNVEEIITFRKKAERSFKNRNLFIAGIVSVWVIHVIDLKFFKSKKVGVKGDVGKNSVNIGFYYSF